MFSQSHAQRMKEIDAGTKRAARKLAKDVRLALSRGNHDFARHLLRAFVDVPLMWPSIGVQWFVFGVVVVMQDRINRAPIHVVVTPGGKVFESWLYRGNVQPATVRALRTKREVYVDEFGGVWVGGKRLETRLVNGSHELIAGGNTISADVRTL